MGEIAPEVVERAIQLVRDLAEQPGGIPSLRIEALALVALLPEPVDPDLVEARKLAADSYEAEQFTAIARNIREGRETEGVAISAALAGIKRGRELAK